MDWENLDRLKAGDEMKIVLADRADYDWAVALLARRPPRTDVPVLLSPVHGALDPKELAGWMTHDGVSARLQLQIHKYIWGPDCRGV